MFRKWTPWVELVRRSDLGGIQDDHPALEVEPTLEHQRPGVSSIHFLVPQNIFIREYTPLSNCQIFAISIATLRIVTETKFKPKGSLAAAQHSWSPRRIVASISSLFSTVSFKIACWCRRCSSSKRFSLYYRVSFRINCWRWRRRSSKFLSYL